MLITEPFWRDNHPKPVGLDGGDLPERADVVVVGAGFTGLNAARVMADAGLSVVIVDSVGVGAGASSVNGGMVNHGLKASIARVFRRFGEELGREFWDAALRSIDLVEQVITRESINCSFVRAGAAELGYRRRDITAFRQESQWMQDHLDFETTVVTGDDMAGVIGSETFPGAMVDTVGAGLHPARYVYGLGAAVVSRGVTIVGDAPVTAISRTTTGYQLLTPRGKTSGSHVLLATNGYTASRPVPQLRRRVMPVGSYIVVTEPLAPDLAEQLIPGNRMLWTARRFLNYFRRTPDDRILMGGRNDLSVDLDLAESARRLKETTLGIFPQLSDARFTHSWTGRLGVTFDLMPHIGRIDGMWYALGYGGHGVGIATYVGSEVGGLIAGTLDRSPFEEVPHPTRPYYRGEPWFLPAAARWYRFLDRVGR